MKRKILSISLLILTLSAFMTLTNCKEDPPPPPPPCVPPDAPIVKKTITVNEKETVKLTASLVDFATYKWTGPNNYSSTDTNPIINAATVDMSGEYKVVITVNGCASLPASTFVNVYGQIEDIRGDENGNQQFYKTIKIGTQTWMSENLKWKPATFSNMWKVYGNQINIGKVYGTLYNYDLAKSAASGMKGWRVPTDDDWKTLVNYLDSTMHAGAKLKEAAGANPAHWTPPNSQATNTSGFTAYGSGYFDVINGLGFQDLNNIAYFWTSTPYETFMIIYRLQTSNSWAERVYGAKTNFYSVRLIKIP